MDEVRSEIEEIVNRENEGVEYSRCGLTDDHISSGHGLALAQNPEIA